MIHAGGPETLIAKANSVLDYRTGDRPVAAVAFNRDALPLLSGCRNYFQGRGLVLVGLVRCHVREGGVRPVGSVDRHPVNVVRVGVSGIL